MKKIILTTEEQKVLDMMFQIYFTALKAKAFHPLYMTKPYGKSLTKIIHPGAVLKTKSGKIKRFRLRKLK